jgi:hypothetical protein
MTAARPGVPMTAPRKGQRVRITIKAGLVQSVDSVKFAADCEPGTLATYRGRHARLKGWHVIDMDDGMLAILASGHFEVA